MNQKSLTKEERYLLALYKFGLGAQDRYLVGQQVHLSPKGVNTIVHQLVRGNLVKKVDETLVSITPSGVRMAELLVA